MRVTHSEFVISNTDVVKCPKEPLAEYVFIGRSNVGKSSLINTLCARKNLAKTSGRPGKTQLINHFKINKNWFLVDLPGYGYASAPKTDIKAWTNLTRKYLAGRPSLQRVFLLIDSRRGVGPADHDIMALLDETAVSWAVVITKADKQKAESLAKICKETKAKISKYVAAYPELFITSSEDGTGIEALRAHLSGFALPKADRTAP